MSIWARFVGYRPIVTRLVLAVALTMTVVLLASGGFVFWRVKYALNRQLDQDLGAYLQTVDRAVATGRQAPHHTPGETYQVYDLQGRIVGGDATGRLVAPHAVAMAAAGRVQHEDAGRLLPPAQHPYRVAVARTPGTRGRLVVAAAISKRKHDEALRELMLQLAIADLATLAAASLVGYATARAALNPVERYRLAAAHADSSTRLPIPDRRPDELTRLGETFNALLDRIDAANRRERQFLADASHELRSPLSLLRTELEWAALRPRSEEERQTTFASIRAQVERLIHLSNGLLDLEELRAGPGDLSGEVDLNRVVESVVHRYGRQLAETGREIELLSRPGAVLRGSEHWIDLALDNLLANAIRHGRGTIDVRVRDLGDHLTLTVSDEGAGFPSQFIPQAFDRFTRAEDSRSSGGSGLGLALVRAVTDAHGGTAHIKGNRVTLTFPALRRSSGVHGD